MEDAIGNSGSSNRMSAYNTIEEERAHRQEAVANQIQTCRSQ